MTLSLINATRVQLALEVDQESRHDHTVRVADVASFGTALARRPHSSGATFRGVYLILSTVWLTVDIAANAVRRHRSRRVRRYANPGPAWPAVVTGPVPLIRPRVAVA
ncbi:hypothetical protein DFP74_2238 [Nocardiopsis sp. Huas11]|uniref:hypothetical protein n=1 Tax=Nocardiopsis sp. Huas11 TaxID=2183912 RepID=UPI000F214CE1|nr:hypothetical protein [Nocardiopsis sp. Huas11]RKS06598.1 hypothetical protein DFP74_2238 [Nocardiopsis sp. Huas11]